MAESIQYDVLNTEVSSIRRITGTSIFSLGSLVSGAGYVWVTCATNEIRFTIDGTSPSATGTTTAIIRTTNGINRLYVKDLSNVKISGSVAGSIGNIYWEKI